MPYVFGVDGGGSTSRAIMITDAGRVVYLGKGPGVNYHEVGASQVATTLKRLFNEALQASRARRDECIGIGLGLAGVSREQDHKLLTGMFDPVFGKDAYTLTSDAEIALLSGTLSEMGILVIAGTGSIVYGRNQEGAEARAGGYGPLLADDGSGYHIAVECFRRILRAHDGMEEPNALTEPVLAHYNLKSLDELVSWINSSTASREKIASVAPLVIHAALEDDPVALDILSDQADRLVLGVEAVWKRLQMADRFDVVLSGGVFAHSPKYREFIQRKIRYLLPGAQIFPPKLDPVLGAAFFAFSQAGITINDDLLDIIRQTYKEQLQQQTKPAKRSPEPTQKTKPQSQPAVKGEKAEN